MSKAKDYVIRDSVPNDINRIHAIYSHWILNRVASFDLVPPPLEALQSKRDEVLNHKMPYLVADFNGQVVGYAYASQIDPPQEGYRYTLADSIYIAPGYEYRGIGKALLSTLIARCELGPWRQMVAGISDDSEHPESMNLHTSLGFQKVAHFESIGFKFGRWVDVIFMQRALGEGTNSQPILDMQKDFYLPKQ